ncbi:hypothetical protein B0J12DRAFT_411902 [Macrophomina phaseolina]|uniref:Secreted protein n=1 Tax=Macrophomina phaseolina TaxID=35725 RepID=A0ABQ8GJ86_9PEZI|nr:hypothetical protein B0J12DRAFT_411902 [Macrophomina phaseolina]
MSPFPVSLPFLLLLHALLFTPTFSASLAFSWADDVSSRCDILLRHEIIREPLFRPFQHFTRYMCPVSTTPFPHISLLRSESCLSRCLHGLHCSSNTPPFFSGLSQHFLASISQLSRISGSEDPQSAN